MVNLLQLQQQLTIDTYAEDVLSQAQVMIVRVIGGRSYWSYGLEVVEETAQRTGAALIILPGDERPDPNLLSHSTVSLAEVNQIWRYFIEGGVENYSNLLKFVAAQFLHQPCVFEPPRSVARIGIYGTEAIASNIQSGIGILFYRAHYLSGNTAAIDALCQGLVQRKSHSCPDFCLFAARARGTNRVARVLRSRYRRTNQYH